MLYLLFRLGHDRYVLETSSVQEVLPVVQWKEIPQVARGVLGVFNYHGEIVPLVDLSEFIVHRSAQVRMSTRIILVRCPLGVGAPDGSERLLGLLAEDTTFTLRAEPSQFVEAGVEVRDAPYLGPVLTDESGIVQLIAVERLLPSEVKEQLFLQADSSAGASE